VLAVRYRAPAAADCRHACRHDGNHRCDSGSRQSAERHEPREGQPQAVHRWAREGYGAIGGELDEIPCSDRRQPVEERVGFGRKRGGVRHGTHRKAASQRGPHGASVSGCRCRRRWRGRVPAHTCVAQPARRLSLRRGSVATRSTRRSLASASLTFRHTCVTPRAEYTSHLSTRSTAPRVFLLSPANCGGIRARQVVSDAAQFALAVQLRAPGGAALGDVFSFVSGLYFRGKLAYARRFACPPDPADRFVAGGVLVITPNAGLRAADVAVTADSIRAFAGEPIDLTNSRYRVPLERGARALYDSIGADCEVVLLGSIASGKYVEVL